MTTPTPRTLIALDVDGTVLLADETPSPGILEAVRDAVAAGHEVTLSTGRAWRSTERVLELLDITPEYVVCANGAVIYRRTGEGYELFHTETFDPAPALALLRERIPDAHYMVELADGTRLYTEELQYWDTSNAHRVAFDDLGTQLVSRVVVVSPDHDEDDFLQLVSEVGLNEVSYAIGWTAWLDIAPMGVDKGSGLDLVCGWLGHDRSRTVVIGDGRNDLGMFAWAATNGGTAVAMGQAPDEVQRAASTITLPVEDGGVAQTLDELGLRRH